MCIPLSARCTPADFLLVCVHSVLLHREPAFALRPVAPSFLSCTCCSAGLIPLLSDTAAALAAAIQQRRPQQQRASAGNSSSSTPPQPAISLAGEVINAWDVVVHAVADSQEVGVCCSLECEKMHAGMHSHQHVRLFVSVACFSSAAAQWRIALLC